MPSIYCEQCGNELLVKQQDSSKICPYCGARNRIPASITRTERMYQMAVRYRMRKNFDAAIEYYENILEEDSSELEACWGILLCKYGVEYLNNSAGEREIRCHRICESAVTGDIYYKMISTYADAQQLEYYAAEAVKIQQAQQKLLSFVKREAKYDVYLCYKEQGLAEGDATDKENISELVSFLEKQGIRVFYNREKIEEMHPGQLDQYLLAAQYASPVMIVYGSKKSFFNHEAVRKEWSSYRSLMTEKKTKKMYVACSEAFMYHLPEVLLDLPKFNIDSLEFYEQIQKEIFGGQKEKNTVPGNSEAENLYIRAQFAMEDGNFEEANRYYNRILEKHPEEGRAYWGRLLCEYKCVNGEQLRNKKQRIDEMPSYKFAIRYAAHTDKEYYEEIAESILNEIRANEKAEHDEKMRQQQKLQEEQLSREKQRMEKEIAEQKRQKKKKAFRKKIAGAFLVAIIIGAAGAVLWYQQQGQYVVARMRAAFQIKNGRYSVAEEIIEEQMSLGLMSEDEHHKLYNQWASALIEEGSISQGIDKFMEIREDATAAAHLKELQQTADDLMKEGNVSQAFYYYSALREYNPQNIETMRNYVRTYRDWLSVYDEHAVIKKADGTAVIYGWDMDTSLTESWTNLAGVYTSKEAVFGWTEEGTVYAAGAYSSKTFSGWKDIVQIVGNSDNVLGLTKSGTVLSLRSGTDKPVAGIENIQRMAMGTDGSVALLEESGKLHYYNCLLNVEQGEFEGVIETAFAGSTLMMLHEDDFLEFIGGSPRVMQNSDPEYLMIYPSMSFVSYLQGDGCTGGSFCGANHSWFFFNGPRALVTGSGSTQYYDEYREMNEEAIYYITLEGEVCIRYSVHSYDSMGISKVGYSEFEILNIYE